MKKKLSKDIKTVLDILQDEVDGDVSAALKKITKDHTTTWMYTRLKKMIYSQLQEEISKKNSKKYIR